MKGNAKKRAAALQEQLGEDCIVRIRPFPRAKTLLYSIYCVRCARDGTNPYEAFSTDRELTLDADKAKLPLVIALWRKHHHDHHQAAA